MMYGNVLYNQGADIDCDVHRGAAQGIYMRNTGARKFVSDNVFVNGFHGAIQIFGRKSPLNNITIDGNIWANNGAASTLTAIRMGLHLWTNKGNPPVTGLVVESNVGWVNPPFGTATVQIAGFSPIAIDRFNDNYLVGVTSFGEKTEVREAVGNVFYGKGGGVARPRARFPVVESGAKPAEQCRKYRRFVEAHPNNEYRRYSEACPGIPAGVERHGPPRKNRIVVRPNRFEPLRAHVAIINWEKAPSVALDLSAVLERSQPYVIINAENYFGPPVASGVFDGSPVSITMNAPELAPAQPVADESFGVGITDDEMTGSRFVALVVQGGAVSRKIDGRHVTVRETGRCGKLMAHDKKKVR